MYFDAFFFKIHSYLKWCFIENIGMDIVHTCNRIENQILEILDAY